MRDESNDAGQRSAVLKVEAAVRRRQLRYSASTLSGSTDADAAPEFQIQLLGGPALTVGGVGTDILL